MRLYLMRHGKADFGGADELRPLSERGVKDVKYVAQYLADQDLPISRIHHSTLLRARQTAELMAAALNPEHPIEERLGIEPWGDIEAFLQLAGGFEEDTLVCGHEPFMGQAAMMLQTDNPDYITVKTATVMAFESDGQGNWVMDWLINPGLLRKEKI